MISTRSDTLFPYTFFVMFRPPPISTRTVTLLPSTTLFRSVKIASGIADASALAKTAQDVISRDESLTSLTTKPKAKADGKLAAQTADAYLGGGDYQQAIDLYRLALEKGDRKSVV